MRDKVDSGGNEGDNWRGAAEDGENHENENDSAITSHNGLIFIGEVARKYGGKNFFTIQRVDRD